MATLSQIPAGEFMQDCTILHQVEGVDQRPLSAENSPTGKDALETLLIVKTGSEIPGMQRGNELQKPMLIIAGNCVRCPLNWLCQPVPALTEFAGKPEAAIAITSVVDPQNIALPVKN